MNELVEVKELRERYMYNINPWVSHMAKRGLRLFYTESDVEETDSDDDIDSKSTVVVASNDTSKTRSKTFSLRATDENIYWIFYQTRLYF
jgi:hypothetical protein